MAPCCSIEPPAEDKPKIAFHAAMMAIQVSSGAESASPATALRTSTRPALARVARRAVPSF
jgi:hypothetical protein